MTEDVYERLRHEFVLDERGEVEVKGKGLMRTWFLLDRKPADAVRRTVRGMLPKNRLGRQQLTKLKVYAGPTHPHQGQRPQPLIIDGARARS